MIQGTLYYRNYISTYIFLQPDDETQLKNLITIDGKSLSNFEADDGYNGEKWKMTFTITPEGN